MGFAHRHVGIQRIEGFCPQAPDVHMFSLCGRYEGLSAAVDTAAGASHDLNKIIILPLCFSPDPARSSHGKDRRPLPRVIFLPAAPYSASLMPSVPRTAVKFQVGQFFTGKGLHCGTKRCFHHTAGSAEDDTGTGGLLPADGRRCRQGGWQNQCLRSGSSGPAPSSSGTRPHPGTPEAS